MGRMRSSNWDDVRSFHFLMIVHMIAVPPTHAAMTIRTVNVVRVILDDDEVGAAEVLGEASDACVVTVTWALVGVNATRGVLTAVIDVREGVDEGELDDDDRVLDEEERGIELEPVFVSEPSKPLRPKGSLAEDVGEGEAEGVLEEAGVFLEGVGVLDGVGDKLNEVLVADAEAVSEGGLAPAPLTAPGLEPLNRPSPTPWGRGARFLIRRLICT